MNHRPYVPPIPWTTWETDRPPVGAALFCGPLRPPRTQPMPPATRRLHNDVWLSPGPQRAMVPMAGVTARVLLKVSWCHGVNARSRLPQEVVARGPGWTKVAQYRSKCNTLCDAPRTPPPPRPALSPCRTARAAKGQTTQPGPHSGTCALRSPVPPKSPTHGGQHSSRSVWSASAQEAQYTGGSCHDWKAPVLHLCLRVPQHCGISRQREHI